MTLKTPTLKPSASALPLPIPELNTEEKLKFESLLKVVKSWREIPSPKGKQGPITESEIFWLTQECLLRYLRATKWDLAQSEKRLLNTLTWRRDFGVDDITGDIISSENETGKQVLVGYDNLARPCYYMFPGRQNSLAGPKQVQHVVYMMERVIDLMVPNQEKVIILIDFKSSSKIGPNISQAREILDIIQTHYPERLGMALIQNTPWVVSGFFKLISPFIDSTTREKLNFNQDVTSFVPTEQLCKEFKGSLDFEYDHEVYWPTLVKICKDKKAEQFERWTQAGKCYGESEAYLRAYPSEIQIKPSNMAASQTIKPSQTSNMRSQPGLRYPSSGKTIFHRPLNRSRNTELSQASFAYLFGEMVGYAQNRVTGIQDLEKRLNIQGYPIGLKLLDLLLYREPPRSQSRPLNVIALLQFITTAIWRHLFSRPADTLEKSSNPDTPDEYMISDNEPVVNQYISVPKEMNQLNCAAFVAGVIEGVCDGAGFPARVTAHSVGKGEEGELWPGKTVFLIKFKREVLERETLKGRS